MCSICDKADKLNPQIEAAKERLKVLKRKRAKIMKPHLVCKTCGILLEQDHEGGPGREADGVGVLCRFCYKDYGSHLALGKE